MRAEEIAICLSPNHNELSTFNFNNNKIRVVTINDQPWFVAIDIYDVLYGKRTGLNTTKILDADEIKVVYRHRKQPSDLSTVGRLFTGTRASHFALISESGLNRLVMRSDVPKAKPFQDWVTREVLPTIRKTGSYSVNQEDTHQPETCDLKSLMAAVVETNRLLQAVLMRDLQAPSSTAVLPMTVPYRDMTLRLARDARLN